MTISLPILKVSPSQLDNFGLCRRKWFMDSVMKAPRLAKGSQVFGTVLHGVVERYLLADNLGRDPLTGQPVNLYPRGWHIARSRFDANVIEGEINPEDQILVKKLVEKAITEGVLKREPDREVESKFEIEVPLPDDRQAIVWGFIDHTFGNVAEDHKTTKNMRYAKSAKELTESPQMMVYLKSRLELFRAKGWPIPAAFKAVHNVYCKDASNPKVKRTAVEVTPEYIDWYFENRVVTAVAEMMRIKETIKDILLIPEPPKYPQPCNAFGGCPYTSICSGEESVGGYLAKVDGLVKAGYTLATTSEDSLKISQSATSQTVSAPAGDPPMSMLSKLAMMASNPNPNAAPAPAPITGSTPPPNVTQPAVPSRPGFVPFVPQTAPQTNPQTGAAAQAGVVAGAVAPAAAPAAAPAQQPASAASGNPTPRNTTGDTPPWAQTDCSACGGSGFNTKGRCCAICTQLASQRGGPSPMDFNTNPAPNGDLQWIPKDPNSDLPMGRARLVGSEAPATVKVNEAPAPTQAPQTAVLPPQVAAQQAPAPQPPAEETEGEKQAKAEKDGRGRPKKGFLLIVNGIVKGSGARRAGSGRFVYDLGTLLTDQVYPAIVQAHNNRNPAKPVEHAFEIDVWQRRDLISLVGPGLVETFGADMVTASIITTGDSDLRRLFDAIRPFAGDEIHPGI